MTFNHGRISITVIAMNVFPYFSELINCHCQFGTFFFSLVCLAPNWGKSRYHISSFLWNDRNTRLKMKDNEPELIGSNLIPLDVKSHSGDCSTCQDVFRKTHLSRSPLQRGGWFQMCGQASSLRCSPSARCTFSPKCQNLWTWFPITRDLSSAKRQGV